MWPTHIFSVVSLKYEKYCGWFIAIVIVIVKKNRIQKKIYSELDFLCIVWRDRCWTSSIVQTTMPPPKSRQTRKTTMDFTEEQKKRHYKRSNNIHIIQITILYIYSYYTNIFIIQMACGINIIIYYIFMCTAKCVEFGTRIPVRIRVRIRTITLLLCR